MPTAPLRLLTREEYHRAGDVGLFRPEERLELFEGEVILKVSPQRRPHRKGVRAVALALENAVGENFVVWTQLPLVLSDFSEPEPDVMVLLGPEDKYDERDPIAQDVALLVEVSDSTLLFDSVEKASRYAASGIPEYWVLDVTNRQLQVRRKPTADQAAPFEFSYRDLAVLTPGQTVKPLLNLQVIIRINELLD